MIMEPMSTIMFAFFIVHLIADRIPKGRLKTRLARKIRIIVVISSLCASVALAFIIVFLR